MARLKAATRNRLPASTFGLPKSRDYPMPDKKHARLAKSGASRALRVGNITAGEKGEIDAKADRKLAARFGGAIDGAAKRPSLGRPGRQAGGSAPDPSAAATQAAMQAEMASAFQKQDEQSRGEPQPARRGGRI